jgi:hypothetical protein
LPVLLPLVLRELLRAVFLDDVPAVLREVFRDDFRGGTFAPFSRASLKPIAIACLRLVTLRPDPLLSVPFFLRLIADSTRFEAPLPYFAMLLPPAAAPAIHVLELKEE